MRGKRFTILNGVFETKGLDCAIKRNKLFQSQVLNKKFFLIVFQFHEFHLGKKLLSGIFVGLNPFYFPDSREYRKSSLMVGKRQKNPFS